MYEGRRGWVGSGVGSQLGMEVPNGVKLQASGLGHPKHQPLSYLVTPSGSIKLSVNEQFMCGVF